MPEADHSRSLERAGASQSELGLGWGGVSGLDWSEPVGVPDM